MGCCGQLNPFKDRIKIYKDANKGKELMTVNFLEVHNIKVNQEYVTHLSCTLRTHARTHEFSSSSSRHCLSCAHGVLCRVVRWYRTVKTEEDVELVISVSLDFKVVGPADMMYFPGMAENFPYPAQPVVREVLRNTVAQMSIKLFIEDTACLDQPLLSALNREFDRRKVGLRVETGIAPFSLLPLARHQPTHACCTHSLRSASAIAVCRGGGLRTSQRVPHRQVAQINPPVRLLPSPH